ncbi:MAG: 50S ribosomal protein L6 [Sedimentisphaerales bacterium]|nr:50S ribosomal protein L6 [Sedimentisphaerales bacterium]
MSRIGKTPIKIPEGVKVQQKGQYVKVTGPLGDAEMHCHPGMKVRLENGQGTIIVSNNKPQIRQNRQLHGTMRALIANMVTGVSKGFEKKMELYGTGYNVKQHSDKLVFQVGFSHSVEMPIPKGIKVTIKTEAARGNEVPSVFTLTSTDKEALGQFAANIRKIRPPEPYKGKGIRYADEQVRHKVGKAFTSGTA